MNKIFLGVIKVVYFRIYMSIIQQRETIRFIDMEAEAGQEGK